jgi:hypothetical protein
MSSDNDDMGTGQLLGLPDPDGDPVHARVRAALGETGASLAPKPGWEEKVWAQIDAGGTAATPAQPLAASPRWGWFASGAMLAAAAAVALIVWQPWGGDDAAKREAGVEQVAMAPTISIRQGAQVMRGTTAAPGDTLEVRNEIANAVLWVYFEGTLLVEGGARLEVLLERPGTYHVISTTGPRRAPTALDAALASLVTAGASHRRDVVEVR